MYALDQMSNAPDEIRANDLLDVELFAQRNKDQNLLDAIHVIRTLSETLETTCEEHYDAIDEAIKEGFDEGYAERDGDVRDLESEIETLNEYIDDLEKQVRKG